MIHCRDQENEDDIQNERDEEEKDKKESKIDSIGNEEKREDASNNKDYNVDLDEEDVYDFFYNVYFYLI